MRYSEILAALLERWVVTGGALEMKPVRKAYKMATMDELFDGSEPHLVDGGWVSFDVAAPQGCEIVQQYLGSAVMEHSAPPEWAFPTARWSGKKDSAATHWRYVDAPAANEPNEGENA